MNVLFQFIARSMKMIRRLPVWKVYEKGTILPWEVYERGIVSAKNGI